MQTKQVIYRKDYQVPTVMVDEVKLKFWLDEKATVIDVELQVSCVGDEGILTLNGAEQVTVDALQLDAMAVNLAQVRSNKNTLCLPLFQKKATVRYRCTISPIDNHALEGLYLTQNIFCSDCEPEGFRKIIYYPDRPDIMAIYTVTIIAPKNYTHLLSNGNLIESGEYKEDTSRHYAIWHDPYRKPSYLFALVAGDLAYLEDHHYRPDGRPVRLRIYAQSTQIQQCHFALQALKRAMRWDETRFQLQMDLDIYNIVAVDDFNGGAMENKGLNIFNTKYVLSDSETATDDDFYAVESVIAHEYFHNWTGNRVTCRDWFQLSLKEGLTVFRDQEFSGDQHHSGLQRIRDVKRLRAHQFPEDASPMAHPIRPDSYMEMKNFYTTTVYEKGAEVVRLYQTLLGKDGFAKGLAYYLTQHDGSAATCDDFLAAMRIANQAELPQFEYWYSQSGTPVLQVNSHYNAETQCYTLHFKQILNGSEQPQPQCIPINIALFTAEGNCIHESCVNLNTWQTTLEFQNIPALPTPSLLRNFSAPVKLDYAYSTQDYRHLVCFETDTFNRFEAMQQCLIQGILEEQWQPILDIFATLLPQASQDPALFAELLAIPNVATVVQYDVHKNYAVLHQRRQALRQLIARTFESQWFNLYYSSEISTAAGRAMRNLSLTYLAALGVYDDLVQSHYEQATEMTSRWGGLQTAVYDSISHQESLLTSFLQRFSGYPLLVDKWFSVQAAHPQVSLATMERLLQHEYFNWRTPNRVRAVLGAFANNATALTAQPFVYVTWLMTKILQAEKSNPQLAAALFTPLSYSQNYDLATQAAIHKAIETIFDQVQSANLREKLFKVMNHEG